jgi:RNA polymerase sigma-70 factor (ECF subfamily)
MPPHSDVRSWDVRAGVCAAASEQLDELSDDGLMFLFGTSDDREQTNRLFSELYSRYRVRVSTWCRRVARDREKVDDLTQEVFLRAYRYRRSFRGDARLSTWLYTIARNTCFTALKRAEGEPSSGAEILDAALRGENGLEIHRRLEREEAFHSLWRLIERKLTPTEARVLALHYGHDLPLQVITRQLMLSNPSGAKAYIVNARRKLSAVLSGRRSGRHLAAA